MPRKATCHMDERLQFIARVLAGEDEMTVLCREYGVSRKTGYKWLGRYISEGGAGLAERHEKPVRVTEGCEALPNERDRPAATGAATQAGAPGATAGSAAGRRRLHGRSLVLKAGVELAGSDVSQVGDPINVRADDADAARRCSFFGWQNRKDTKGPRPPEQDPPRRRPVRGVPDLAAGRYLCHGAAPPRYAGGRPHPRRPDDAPRLSLHLRQLPRFA